MVGKSGGTLKSSQTSLSMIYGKDNLGPATGSEEKHRKGDYKSLLAFHPRKVYQEKDGCGGAFRHFGVYSCKIDFSQLLGRARLAGAIR